MATFNPRSARAVARKTPSVPPQTTTSKTAWFLSASPESAHFPSCRFTTSGAGPVTARVVETSHLESCRINKRICNHRSSHCRVPTKTYSATSDDIILSKFRSTNNTTLEHMGKCFVTLALWALKGKLAWWPNMRTREALYKIKMSIFGY